MSEIQVIVLVIVQGLTEFLPISSSGHLVLVPSAFGWSDQGMAFDVAMHFGSLSAVLIYFRGDIVGLLKGSTQFLSGNLSTFESQLALGIGLATIPAAVVGLALGKRALEGGLSQVVFDRAGWPYHGRVKALAEGAREAGLKF